TWASGLRFWLGITASSSWKYSASVRMMPFTRGLNQVLERPMTDSSWRSRMVTIGSAYEHVRPAGVLPTAPNLLVIGLPWIGLPFASTFRQTVVLNPRSSIRVRGIDL